MYNSGGTAAVTIPHRDGKTAPSHIFLKQSTGTPLLLAQWFLRMGFRKQGDMSRILTSFTLDTHRKGARLDDRMSPFPLAFPCVLGIMSFRMISDYLHRHSPSLDGI